MPCMFPSIFCTPKFKPQKIDKNLNWWWTLGFFWIQKVHTSSACYCAAHKGYFQCIKCVFSYLQINLNWFGSFSFKYLHSKNLCFQLVWGGKLKPKSGSRLSFSDNWTITFSYYCLFRLQIMIIFNCRLYGYWRQTMIIFTIWWSNSCLTSLDDKH